MATRRIPAATRPCMLGGVLSAHAIESGLQLRDGHGHGSFEPHHGLLGVDVSGFHRIVAVAACGVGGKHRVKGDGHSLSSAQLGLDTRGKPRKTTLEARLVCTFGAPCT